MRNHLAEKDKVLDGATTHGVDYWPELITQKPRYTAADTIRRNNIWGRREHLNGRRAERGSTVEGHLGLVVWI